MRIALFHNLPSGGAKRHTFEQVRQLSKRGHHIEEFVPAGADVAFCSLAPFVAKQHVFACAPPDHASRRIPLLTPYLHAIAGLRTLQRTDKLNALIARTIDDGGFDLAFAKDCQVIMNPYLLRHVTTPIVFQCHHGLRHQVEASRAGLPNELSLVGRVKSAYYAPARAVFAQRFARDELRNIQSASVVLTNSGFSKALLAQHYGVDAHVVYPGINTQVFQPPAKPKQNYVLCVGALLYSKGYRFLVSAVGQVPAGRRPALFVAANSVDPAEESVVRAMAERVSVDLHVERIDDDRRLVEVYGQARAFVYAPLQEALGMAPLEAMACGTPVVAVAEGGVRETVSDGVTGWLVERDVGVFASRLEALLADDNVREQMAEAGIDYVRNSWTWRGAVDRLERELAGVAAA